MTVTRLDFQKRMAVSLPEYQKNQDSFFLNLNSEDFETAQCFLCRSDESYEIFRNEIMQIVRCSCGFVYNKQQPTKSVLKEFYSKSQAMHDWSVVKKTPRETLRQMQKFTRAVDFMVEAPGQSCIDLGCGNGFMLDMLHKRAPHIELCGVDMNAEALSNLDQLGIWTMNMDVQEFCDWNSKTYSYVNLWGVLEHVKNPVGVLAAARNQMKSDGYMIVCVPNVASRLVRQVWKKAFTFCPQHLWYFDIHKLDRLFETVGLKMHDHWTIEAEELPVLKAVYGFDPYDPVPQWAQVKYMNSDVQKFYRDHIIENKEGYKIVAIGRKA